MSHIYRSALVPFTADQMFALINDINRYESFVPYCQKSRILEQNEQQLVAQLQIAKKGIAKSFTTRNTFDKKNEILMELVDGPFSYLTGKWTFKPLSDSACKIELELDFEFSNKLTSMAFSKIFNKLVQSMLSAFTKRAEEIYA